MNANDGLTDGKNIGYERCSRAAHSRSLFLGAAAGAAATPFAAFGPARAATVGARHASMSADKPQTSSPLPAPKQLDAGVLNVGYVELGPADGPAVILLHGSPYDIHCYVDVAPLLASTGYRVIVPYLRGYGTTHFRSS
jgi:hypothetical protein